MTEHERALRDNWQANILADFASICAEMRLDPEIIKGPGRKRYEVKDRRKTALLLKALNYSSTQIGWVLGGRNHGSILNLVSEKVRATKREGYQRRKAGNVSCETIWG